MKKIVQIALLSGIMTIFTTNIVFASFTGILMPNPDDVVKAACKTLVKNKLDLTCKTYINSIDKKGDLVFAYHDVERMCNINEKELSKKTFQDIVQNNKIKSIIKDLKKKSKESGKEASITNDSVILNNTTDLALSINKCVIDKIKVKYKKSSGEYTIYIQLSDIYDFDSKSIIDECKVMEKDKSVKTCFVAAANNNAVMRQMNDSMSKYNIKINIDYIERDLCDFKRK